VAAFVTGEELPLIIKPVWVIKMETVPDWIV
jgi:hypothetical protein